MSRASLAALFWQLDRGGAVARTQEAREDLPPADFRFSQDENDGGVVRVGRGSSKSSDWAPTLMDYLYVSTTNSTAFSLTDTMPLTSRAKALMALELISALGAVSHRDRARRRLAEMPVLPPR